MRKVVSAVALKVRLISICVGVYDVEQSRKLLSRGRELFNCDIAMHGDELCDLGGAKLAAELKAKSCSHLGESY